MGKNVWHRVHLIHLGFAQALPPSQLPSAQPTTLYDALSFDTVCHAMVPYMLCYAVYTMVPYTICAVYAMVPYTICAIFFSTKVFIVSCLGVDGMVLFCCFAPPGSVLALPMF